MENGDVRKIDHVGVSDEEELAEPVWGLIEGHCSWLRTLAYTL